MGLGVFEYKKITGGKVGYNINDDARINNTKTQTNSSVGYKDNLSNETTPFPTQNTEQSRNNNSTSATTGVKELSNNQVNENDTTTSLNNNTTNQVHTQSTPPASTMNNSSENNNQATQTNGNNTASLLSNDPTNQSQSQSGTTTTQMSGLSNNNMQTNFTNNTGSMYTQMGSNEKATFSSTLLASTAAGGYTNSTGAQVSSNTSSFFSSVFSWFREKVEDLKRIGGKIVEFAISYYSSVANLLISIVKGLAQFIETLYDLLVMIGTGIASIGTGLFDAYQAIRGLITGEEWESATKNMWSGVMGHVATDHVGNVVDNFYKNSALGQFLDEKAFKHFKSDGMACQIGSGIGYAAGLIVLTIATAGIGGAAVGAAGTAAGITVSTTVATAISSGVLVGSVTFSSVTASTWAEARDQSWAGIEALYQKGELGLDGYKQIRSMSNTDWQAIEESYKNGEIDQTTYDLYKNIRNMSNTDWQNFAKEVNQSTYDNFKSIVNMSDTDWQTIEESYKNGEITEADYLSIKSIREMPTEWQTTENLFAGFKSGLTEGGKAAAITMLTVGIGSKIMPVVQSKLPTLISKLPEGSQAIFNKLFSNFIEETTETATEFGSELIMTRSGSQAYQNSGGAVGIATSYFMGFLFDVDVKGKVTPDGMPKQSLVSKWMGIDWATKFGVKIVPVFDANGKITKQIYVPKDGIIKQNKITSTIQNTITAAKNVAEASVLSPVVFASKMFHEPVITNDVIKTKIMTEGLYHITSEASIPKILESGYIKASDNFTSYGSKKSFFFAGVPDFGNVVKNLDTATAGLLTAIKIKPDANQLNSLNYRLQDNAISQKGNFSFNKNQFEIVNLGLFNENGNLVYKELSPSEAKNYKTSEDVLSIFNMKKSSIVIRSITEDLLQTKRLIADKTKSLVGPATSTITNTNSSINATSIEQLNQFYEKNGKIINTSDSVRNQTLQIFESLNYNAQPQILSSNDFISLINETNQTVLYRGLSGDSISEVSSYVDSFKYGELYVGDGKSGAIRGTGIYTGYGQGIDAVTAYSTNGGNKPFGAVMEMTLSPDAKVIDFDTLTAKQTEVLNEYSKMFSKYDKSITDINSLQANLNKITNSADLQKATYIVETLSQISHFGSVLGYDAINDVSKGYMVVLNRGQVIINDNVKFVDSNGQTITNNQIKDIPNTLLNNEIKLYNSELTVEQVQTIKDAEIFLKSDIKIKELLYKIAPQDHLSFDVDSCIKYGDMLHKAISDMRYLTESMIGSKDADITKFYNHLEEKLMATGYDYNKLKQFYKNNLSDMRPELVELVKENCVGYTLFRGIEYDSCNSVNELLHVIHATKINSEEYYQSMPKVMETIGSSGYEVILYGKKTELSEGLFKELIFNEKAGMIDILSLDNSIQLMIRDLGHATTIEIDISNPQDISAKYFIPKICNADMINILPGLHAKVNNDSTGATGTIRTDSNNFVKTISEFLNGIPTDMDMFSPGGSAYRPQDLNSQTYRADGTEMGLFDFINKNNNSLIINSNLSNHTNLTQSQIKAINDINKKISQGEPVELSYKSTTEITSAMLNSITDLSKVKISIIDGLGDANGNLKNKYQSNNYYERINYTGYELKNIITQLESIQSRIDMSLPIVERAKQVYDIVSEIPVLRNRNTKEEWLTCQSLRGITSDNIIGQQGLVCAGYASVFKEVCDRVGISADYVRGTGYIPASEESINSVRKEAAAGNSKAQSRLQHLYTLSDGNKYWGETHAWNVVITNEGIIPVDICWKASGGGEWFGANKQFALTHISDSIDEIYHVFDQPLNIAKQPIITKGNTTIENIYSIISVHEQKYPGQGMTVLKAIVNNPKKIADPYGYVTSHGNARNMMKSISITDIQNYININDSIDFAIKTYDIKYGTGMGIKALDELIKYNNFNKMTSTNGAREMLRQFSISDIKKVFDIKFSNRTQTIANNSYRADGSEMGLFDLFRKKKNKSLIEPTSSTEVSTTNSDITTQKIDETKQFFSKLTSQYGDCFQNSAVSFLQGAIITNIEIRTNVVLQDTGVYKIYPNDSSAQKNAMIENEIASIANQYIKSNDSSITLESLVRTRTEQINKATSDIKQSFMSAEILPYYGPPQFLFERSKYIAECMNDILNSPYANDSIKQKVNDNITKVITNINQMQEVIKKKKISQTDYDLIEESYINIKRIEDSLSKDVEQIWKGFLTDPKDFKEGERFAYLAHVLTGDRVSPDKMQKVCLTLITSETLTLPYGNIGYLYPMDMEHIVAICNNDAGSWPVTKAEFIERGFSTEWQFAEEGGITDSKVFFEESKISKLIMPDVVERTTIENNIRINGEKLNYDKAVGYNELYAQNKDKKFNPIGVFYNQITPTINEKDLNVAKTLSEQLKIPSINININNLRNYLN